MANKWSWEGDDVGEFDGDNVEGAGNIDTVTDAEYDNGETTVLLFGADDKPLVVKRRRYAGYVLSR